MEQEHAQKRQPLSKDDMDVLHGACESDDVDDLERLIESLQPTREDLKSCLWSAIEANRAQIVQYLLEQKYDSVDNFMVQRALESNAISVLDVLKKIGWSNVNMTMAQTGPSYVGEAQTALFYATHSLDVVRYLLERGADPNLGSATGGGLDEAEAYRLVSDSGAILQSAAMYGSVETLDLLLSHGANLSNAATMHAAAEGENIEVMEHLINLGVVVDQDDSYRTMGLPRYGTPLLRAMHLGKPRAVRFLLNHGASTLRKCPGAEGTGMTPMDLAERGRIEDEIRRMIQEVGERREGDHLKVRSQM